MSMIQIPGCCSWHTPCRTIQVDYWANANRPMREDGTDGGYGMYTVTRLADWTHLASHTNKRDAFRTAADAAKGTQS